MSDVEPAGAQDNGRRSSGTPAAAINAHYYNITETESWPVAGSIVLLDGQGQPVRGELHIYDDLPSHIQEGAVRESRQLLQSHYVSDAVVPMRVLQTSQMRDAVDVRLDVDAAVAGSKRRRPLPFLAIAGALALVAILLFAAFSMGGSQGVTREEMAAINRAIVGLAAERAVQSPEASQEPAEQTALPASRNARADLAIGSRVALVPGLRLTLRSEPGGESGVPVGYMMDDDTAVIVGGPREVAGNSDTIVWWLVSLEDGTEAWAAANTSDQALLIPLE